MKLIYLALTSLILIGCGSVRVDIANIQKLEIDYNSSQNINHGSKFAGNVMAVMIDGEEIDVTGHKHLEFNSRDLESFGKNQMRIISHPTSFDSAYVFATITMDDGKESFTSIDSIPMNYKGPITVIANGEHGRSGDNGSKGGTRLLGRDGKDGGDGEDGQGGQSGGNYTAHVWKEGKETRIRIQNDGTQEIWRYKTIGGKDVEIEIGGGHGGNGGNGGEGGDGKDGIVNDKKDKSPGDGGNGGRGGSAGAGGDGGSLLVFVHENAADAVEIQIRNAGGDAGVAGQGGVAGRGGSPDSGQTAGSDGMNGMNGLSAGDGTNGPQMTMSVISFDFSGM